MNNECDDNKTEHSLTIRHSIYKQRYVQMPAIALADKELSLSAKAVLGVITDFCGADGDIFPKQKTLAKRLGCSRPTISKYLHELKEKGYLDWELTNTVPPKNHYYLDMPKVTKERFNYDAWKINPDVINKMPEKPSNSTIVKQVLHISDKQGFTQSESQNVNDNAGPGDEKDALTNTLYKPRLHQDDLDKSKEELPVGGDDYYMMIDKKLADLGIRVTPSPVDSQAMAKIKQAGVDIDIVLATMDEVYQRNKDAPNAKRIKSFGYFVSPIMEAHEKQQKLLKEKEAHQLEVEKTAELIRQRRKLIEEV